MTQNKSYIILTCLDNHQEYILINIQQLIKLNHSEIIVITNKEFFEYYSEYNTKIKLIDKNSLNDSYNFENETKLDKKFRNKFWTLTSARFFYIYEYMKQYDVDNSNNKITDVIHLENDVLIYHNIDEIINKIDKNYMYIPFDTYTRNVASILYIPNTEIYKKILDEYDFNKNDMYNFSQIKEKTNLIKNFPIFSNEIDNLTAEEKFVSENFEIFNNEYIFDGAAIGQYLGGIDPKNTSKNTIGFVNETCVVKYNKYKIWFETINNNKIPYIELNNKKIKIFNLHIHCKKLENFV